MHSQPHCLSLHIDWSNVGLAESLYIDVISHSVAYKSLNVCPLPLLLPIAITVPLLLDCHCHWITPPPGASAIAIAIAITIE